MKRLVIILALLGLFFGLSGCTNTVKEQGRSAFYTDFSIGDIVARHEQFLLPAPRTVSGSAGGPAAPPYQKYEVMHVQIELADVPKFMEAVKGDIQDAILDSGARIEGQEGSFQDPVIEEADIDSISFRYSQDETTGIINLYGVNSEDTHFFIIVILTEN